MNERKKAFAFIVEGANIAFTYFRITRAAALTDAIASGELQGTTDPIDLLGELGQSREDFDRVIAEHGCYLFNDYYFKYFDLVNGRLSATYTDGIFYASASDLIKRAQSILAQHSASEVIDCLDYMVDSLNGRKYINMFINQLERGGGSAKAIAQGYSQSWAQILLGNADDNLLKKNKFGASLVHAISALHSIAKSVMREEVFVVNEGLLEKPPFDKCDGLRWVLASEGLMKASEDLIIAETYRQEEDRERQKIEQAAHGRKGATQNDMRYEPLRKKFIEWFLANRPRFNSDSNACRHFQIEIYDKLPVGLQVLKSGGNHRRTFSDWKRLYISKI